MSPPLRVTLDGCCLGRRKTGNETYIRGLLQGFDELGDKGPDLTVLTTAHHTGTRQASFHWKDIPLGNFATRNFATIPRHLSSSIPPPDLYHATYWTRFWSMPVPPVVMIHDISFVSFPQGFKTHERLVYANMVRAVARKARHILTVSDFSKMDMIDKWDIPPEKITVTYEAVEPCFRPREKSGPLPEIDGQPPYILFVGNLHPRKNLVRLIEAFVRLKQDSPSKVKLKIVGQKAWLFGDIFEIVRKYHLEDQVEFTGYVTQEELIRLYQHAAVSAYPSLFEGFGFPVLESMACGCPVVTSSTTSIPEVAGDAAILVDPSSIDEIAAGLSRVLNDSTLRESLHGRGLEQVKKFSWSRCAAETMDVYRLLSSG